MNKIKSNFYKNCVELSQLHWPFKYKVHLKVSPTINNDIYRIKLSLPIFKKVPVCNFI